MPQPAHFAPIAWRLIHDLKPEHPMDTTPARPAAPAPTRTQVNDRSEQHTEETDMPWNLIEPYDETQPPPLKVGAVAYVRVTVGRVLDSATYVVTCPVVTPTGRDTHLAFAVRSGQLADEWDRAAK